MKFNRTLILLLVGLVAFEMAAAIIVGMAGAMGTDFITYVSTTIRLIRIINVALCGPMAVSSLCAGKLRKISIVPFAACAVEVLLVLIVAVFPSIFLKMENTPPDVTAATVEGIRIAGLGMLIGMVLAILSGVLVAKKRIIIPVLVIVVAAVLSVAVYDGMLYRFTKGMTSTIAVGFLQPFAFLFPVFGFDKTECITVSKNIHSESAKKPEENKKYSYLEAYKNKHKETKA